MTVFELLWFALHAAVLAISAAWLGQFLPWYVAFAAGIAATAVLVGLELAWTRMTRR